MLSSLRFKNLCIRGMIFSGLLEESSGSPFVAHWSTLARVPWIARSFLSSTVTSCPVRVLKTLKMSCERRTREDRVSLGALYGRRARAHHRDERCLSVRPAARTVQSLSAARKRVATSSRTGAGKRSRPSMKKAEGRCRCNLAPTNNGIAMVLHAVPLKARMRFPWTLS